MLRCVTRQLSNTINTKGSRYISYTQKAIDYLKEFNGDPKQMDRNKIGTYWSSSIVCTEFPNLVSPKGHIRKYDQLFQGLESAEKVIKDQQYNIKTTTTSKDNEKLVIIELTWIGTLSIDVAPWNIKSGDKLTAEICCLIEFGDDDLIINQKNYDCYYDPKATTEKKNN